MLEIAAVADRPWLIRTYSGHSSAHASNELYRTNLTKGQTGLSVAFDLPTQTGYDPDHILARGEVGKVGVPVPHLGEMETLFDGIPLGEMNTSMTINATAMWLVGMYLALADEQGVDYASLQGTTQNDILKEYLSRGTYIFPPEASKRLTVDLIVFMVQNVPQWNPINVCPYHLQEAGATPVQELAYGLANAIAVLDAVRDSGQIPEDEFPQVVGRISFFIDAGVRFVEEMCKMRAFTQMWDHICRDALRRHRREAAPLPLRHAGELARPHRGAAREQHPTHRVGDARRHAVQGRACARGATARVGTRRSACRRRGINSGRCASSRCSRTSPTCSSTATCSKVRRSWRRRSRNSAKQPRPNCSGSSRAAARSR